MADKKETKAQPSEPSEETKVTSNVPEKAVGQLNPSSPADTGTTPGTVSDIG